MRNFNEDVARRVNGNRPSAPSPFTNFYERPINDHMNDRKNVAWDRVKTNLIYFLIVLIVLLVGILCYTMVIIFEAKSDVLDQSIDKISDVNMPIEQRMWYDNAIDELRDSVKFHHNKRKAKNVILFVGDGMGVSTVTASRIYKYGEEGGLSWESFQHFGLLKVIKYFVIHLYLENYEID